MIDRFDDEYAFLSNYSASHFTDECGDFYFGYMCSNCKAVMNRTKFCGNCGARMINY